MESVNPEFAPSNGKIECTRTNNIFSSLPEVSTGAVSLVCKTLQLYSSISSRWSPTWSYCYFSKSTLFPTLATCVTVNVGCLLGREVEGGVLKVRFTTYGLHNLPLKLRGIAWRCVINFINF